MDELIAFVLTIVSGVVVSLIALSLAGRQRATEEREAEGRRREAVLAAIGAELRWNRTAIRGTLDVDNAHVMIGKLVTVAFERHGGELVTIAPESIEPVFKHYALVGKARAGIGGRSGSPGTAAGDQASAQWIEVCAEASVEVSNSATKALGSLGIPVDTHPKLSI